VWVTDDPAPVVPSPKAQEYVNVEVPPEAVAVKVMLCPDCTVGGVGVKSAAIGASTAIIVYPFSWILDFDNIVVLVSWARTNTLNFALVR